MGSIPTEDYIKQIHILQGARGSVSTSTLAVRLNVAAASVTEMLKRLAQRGLVRYRPYRGVALTERGRLMAMRTLRRHRLWEMYLVRHLGYTWDSVHDEAERLEHATSDVLEGTLDRALGYPAVDPHGDPIPTRSGKLRHGTMNALAAASNGDVLRVRRVTDGDPELLQHVGRLGLTPGAKATVREILPLDGSMRISVRGKERYVSATVAACIFVEPA